MGAVIVIGCGSGLMWGIPLKGGGAGPVIVGVIGSSSVSVDETETEFDKLCE